MLFLALICFERDNIHNSCDLFDGIAVTKTFSTGYSHYSGGLGFYNGLPTTVGSYKSTGYRKVEQYTQNGWAAVDDHPL